jgi:hypothetical protein
MYVGLRRLALISNFVLFDIGVFLSDPAWAAYSVQDTDCGVHIALQNQSLPVAHVPPGPPSAAAAEAALGGAAATLNRCTGRSTGRSRRSGARPPERLPQPPERASTERRSAWFLETRIDWRQVCGRRSGGRSRLSGHQQNAGACDSWRQ